MRLKNQLQLPDRVRRARLATHGRESHSDWRSFPDGGEDLRLGIFRNVVGNFEITESTCNRAKEQV